MRDLHPHTHSLDDAVGGGKYPRGMDEGAPAVLAEPLPAVGVLLLEGHLPRPLPSHHTPPPDDPHVVPVAVGRLPADCGRSILYLHCLPLGDGFFTHTACLLPYTACISYLTLRRFSVMNIAIFIHTFFFSIDRSESSFNQSFLPELITNCLKM